jgi:hypothetical protein
VWKTGFIVGALLGSLVALLSWLAGLPTAASPPPSNVSRPPSSPRLRMVPGRILSCRLDGMPGKATYHEPADAWGPITPDGRLVVALDLRITLDTSQPLRAVDVWLEADWTGATPAREPDLRINWIETGWVESVATRRLPVIPYPFVVVVRNSGPLIVTGAFQIREQVVEVY